jgi:hypothetical protein
MQRLPTDPFHPQFLPQLNELVSLIESFTELRTPGPVSLRMLRHLFEPGLMPWLQPRLQVLYACSPARHTMPGGAPSIALPSGGATTLATFCWTHAALVGLLHASHCPGVCEPSCGELVLASITELLSSAASVKAVLRCGLSQQVLRAAEQGSKGAEKCARDVIRLSA